MSREVRGVFDSRKAVTRAVRRLAAESVPADTIDVYLLDSDGNRTRRVTVHDEPGVVRGAAVGAAAGGALGLAVAILGASGVLGPTTVEFLGLTSVLGAVRAIAMGAAATVPLGALLGLGMWSGGRKIVEREMEEGRSAAVVIRSDAMADTAREVLADAGARDLSD